MRNCVQLGRFTNGAYTIQWMESAPLQLLYRAIDQASELAAAEQNG